MLCGGMKPETLPADEKVQEIVNSLLQEVS